MYTLAKKTGVAKIKKTTERHKSRKKTRKPALVAEAITSYLRHLLADDRAGLSNMQIWHRCRGDGLVQYIPASPPTWRSRRSFWRTCRSDNRADLLPCMLTIRAETMTRSPKIASDALSFCPALIQMRLCLPSWGNYGKLERRLAEQMILDRSKFIKSLSSGCWWGWSRTNLLRKVLVLSFRHHIHMYS